LKPAVKILKAALYKVYHGGVNIELPFIQSAISPLILPAPFYIYFYFFRLALKPLKNVHFCSGSSRRSRTLRGGRRNFNHPDEKPTGTGIHSSSILRVKLKLYFVQKFETNAEIGQKGAF
jgi:hypothetical protein